MGKSTLLKKNSKLRERKLVQDRVVNCHILVFAHIAGWYRNISPWMD